MISRSVTNEVLSSWIEAGIGLKGSKGARNDTPFAGNLAEIQRKGREDWIRFLPDPSAARGQLTHGQSKWGRRGPTSQLAWLVKFGGAAANSPLGGCWSHAGKRERRLCEERERLFKFNLCKIMILPLTFLSYNSHTVTPIWTNNMSTNSYWRALRDGTKVKNKKL